MARNRQVAFLFHEAGDATADLIGNKAMSLVTMTRFGMPVPPGFAITTGVCRAYLEHARYPKRLEWQIKRCIASLEKQTGKRFGDPSNPLLVSVRSGAPVSIPGMMDSILNLGMTEGSHPALKKFGGDRFVDDTVRRFRKSFTKVVGSDASDDPWEQLELAFEAVCQSWLNDRAVKYRRFYGIPEYLGTAMIVQAMVFGNLDEMSGSGVFFSRNVATGENHHYGEFHPRGQGEDVVGGSVTPLPITNFSKRHPEAFQELTQFAEALERHTNDVVEIEFTVERGKLWILQYRVAQRTPVAEARFAVQAVWEKRCMKQDAVDKIKVYDVEALRLCQATFDPRALQFAIEGKRVLAKGIPASPGSAVGIVAFTSEQAQEFAGQGKQVVLIRPETSPDDFPGMLVASAIVTSTGGATSHPAVVARGLGKPAVVGAGPIPSVSSGLLLSAGDTVSVDGSLGLLVLGSVPFTHRSDQKEISIFLKWLKELRPELYGGRVDFSAVEREYSANIILNNFYLADAMASVAVGTDLEQESRALRARIHREAAEVFAAYLIVAVSGELRHGWEGSRWRGAEFAVLQEKFSVRDARSGRSEAQMSVVNRLRNADREMQQEFFRLAIPAFNTWLGGSIGGPRWAAIAKAGLQYLSGELNDTVFADRVFDLRHNGGRLFNKHRMLSETNEDMLQYQLDCKHRQKTIDLLVAGLEVVHYDYRDSYQYDAPKSFWESPNVSPEVAMLWQKGKGRLWDKDVRVNNAGERRAR
ncbi:MAG: pyruvate, phosphate dikinase [bacterium]|nr:pyruvate, phosphate dikinase [bacterium]